jgi:hypothetical protein
MLARRDTRVERFHSVGADAFSGSSICISSPPPSWFRAVILPSGNSGVAPRGGAAKESQKAKGKAQKSRVKGRTPRTYAYRANRGGALIWIYNPRPLGGEGRDRLGFIAVCMSGWRGRDLKFEIGKGEAEPAKQWIHRKSPDGPMTQ